MNKKERTIIYALALVFILLLGVLFVAFGAAGSCSTVGKFVPPEFDANAQMGIPEVTDPQRQFSWLQLGDDIRVALCGHPRLTEGGAEIWFTSDENNTAWLLVKVTNEKGDLLGSSGLLRPGEYVQAVALEGDAAPGSVITVKILSYEPETYYSLGSASAQLLLSDE